MWFWVWVAVWLVVFLPTWRAFYVVMWDHSRHKWHFVEPDRVDEAVFSALFASMWPVALPVLGMWKMFKGYITAPTPSELEETGDKK